MPAAEHAGDIGAERQQRHPADGDLPGKADDEIEPRDEHPIDRGTRCDHAQVGIAEQRQAAPPIAKTRVGSQASRLAGFAFATSSGNVALSFIRVVPVQRRRSLRGAPAGR